MAKIITSFWNKFKTQPDIWFFYGFILTFTLSVRKVLFYFPIQGTFNEYTGAYIYLSDVFLIFTISLWLFTILSNKSLYLSTDRLFSKFHIVRFRLYIKHYLAVDKLWIKKFTHNLYLILPLLLVVLSFISILWSLNKIVSSFRSLKLFEFYILYLYLIFRVVPRGMILKKIFLVTLIVAAMNSLIGIVQFIIQKSIGLLFLKESMLNPDIPGVAKLILNGTKYIRSYGLFPHPNVLGGFLVLSIIFTLIMLKENLFNKKPLIKGILYLQFIALLLTFSKSAILALIISLVYIYWKDDFKNGLLKIFRKLLRFKIAILLALIFLAFLFLITKLNLNSIFFQSLNERSFYLNVSRGIISANPILGIGIGQFILSMTNFTRETILSWQYQPVHNVFLLIWSELGIIGLVLFAWWLFILRNNNHNLSSNIYPAYLKALSLGFIFIMVFDHYFWDIQQGQIMLWLVLGLMTGLKKTSP